MIATGIVALCNPSATLASVAWLIGFFTLISGISAMVFYFSAARGSFGAGAVLFMGITDVVLGAVFLGNSFLMSQLLSFIVGLWLAVFGVERIVRAVNLKNMMYSDRWLAFILGAAAAVLGVMSMVAPHTGAVLVSIVVGIGFIVHGIAFLAILRMPFGD